MRFPDAYNAAQDLITRNLTPSRRQTIAFIDRHGRWTYEAVADRAARFAGVLAGLGVAPEQRVVMCLHDTIDFPTAFLGAMQHGAVPIPLNTRLTPADYGFILADSRASLLVVSADLWPSFADLVQDLPGLQVLVSGDAGPTAQASLTDALQAATPADGFAPTRRGDMAFWLYTSGTTGQPKGAVHAHSHLIETADLYAEPILDIGANDVVYSAAKLYFAYGLGNGLTFPMAVGATAVLLEGPPTPQAVAEIFRVHAPTLFFGVPTLYGMLLAHQQLLPAAGDLSLRLCVSAGEALPEALMNRWTERTGVQILDGLGSTEALHIFLSNRVDAIRPGTTGLPVPGYRVRLVDDDGQPVPVGEIGNLEVSGPTTAMMYWNQRAKTKQTFGGWWMRTGDKYVQNDDGTYTYGGRGDDMMKVGGIWVSPFEVESALMDHASVLECAVVAHADHDGLIKPRAFVVVHDGVQADEEGLAEVLITHVRGALAPYKRPRWVGFVDALPKTATGKIQRYKLRDPD